MTERGEYDDDLMFREVGEPGDWQAGSRVVTFQNNVALAAAKCMPVEDARALVHLLRMYGLKPYELGKVQGLRKRLADRTSTLEMVEAENGRLRDRVNDLLEHGSELTKRVRDAEDLVRILQARVEGTKATEAA